MKALTFVGAVLTALVQAEYTPNPYLNVVNTDLKCRVDSDCKVQDLDYINGVGKPLSPSAVCCATFPRQEWN